MLINLIVAIVVTLIVLYIANRYVNLEAPYKNWVLIVLAILGIIWILVVSGGWAAITSIALIS